jgi:hypothetical protein
MTGAKSWENSSCEKGVFEISVKARNLLLSCSLPVFCESMQGSFLAFRVEDEVKISRLNIRLLE